MKGTSLLALTLLAAAALFAPSSAAAQAADGYIFDRPRVTFTVKGLWDRPNAESDIYDFVTSELTLDRNDFDAAGIGFEFGVRLSDHLDLTAEWAFARSSTRSEFIDWVEETADGEIPIEQTTSLRRQPFNVGLRFFPLDRGRQVGSYAWIPARVSPFAGAGFGRTSYRLVQEGDFVDFETLDIFEDYFQSEGSSWTYFAGAGVDVSLTARFNAVLEGRYSWGDSPVEGDFVGFDPIDLSGFRASMGLGVRF